MSCILTSAFLQAPELSYFGLYLFTSSLYLTGDFFVKTIYALRDNAGSRWSPLSARSRERGGRERRRAAAVRKKGPDEI